MPPHSLCFDFPFFCRSNCLTEVDFSNRKTTFHRLSTFSVASIRALVRPRASLYRFSALSALSAFTSWLQCGNPIHVVIMPVRSWPPRNKMLAKYPFAVKHVLRFRVSATNCFYFFYFSLRSVVSSSSNFPCCGYHLRYSIKSNQFISVTSTSTAQNYAKNRFKLPFPLWSLYWARLFGHQHGG